MSLHDATTGAEVVRLVGHGALVRGIAFAPDGTGLATGGDDRSIKLWDVPAYEPSLSLSANALEGKPTGVRDEARPIGSGSGRCASCWEGCARLRPRRTMPERTRRRQAGRPGRAAASDAQALAGQIDRLLAAKWAEAKVQPARPADDAEYLRRVYLDLVGKIPTAAEARDFLDDPSPDKRTRLVESLLDSPAYLTHATESLSHRCSCPRPTPTASSAALAPTFEAWLRKKVAEEAGYDQIVREVLTVRLGSPGRRGGNRPRSPRRALAAGLLRRQGCQAREPRRRHRADVPGHPARVCPVPQPSLRPLEARGVLGPGRLLRGGLEAGEGRRLRADPRGCRPPRAGDPRDEDRSSRPRSSTPSKPQWGRRASGRELLADWVTAPDNPYFARAAVNRVWARFFGTGIVEPVDDLRRG